MAINSVGSSKYEDPRKRRAMLHGEYSAMLTKSTDKRATPEQREQVKQLISRLLTLSMSGSRSDVRSRFPAKALKLLDSQRVEDNKEFSDLRYHEAIASCADAWEKKLSLSTIASIDVGSAYANQGIDMIVDWNQELWDMQDSILRSFFNGDWRKKGYELSYSQLANAFHIAATRLWILHVNNPIYRREEKFKSVNEVLDGFEITFVSGRALTMGHCNPDDMQAGDTFLIEYADSDYVQELRIELRNAAGRKKDSWITQAWIDRAESDLAKLVYIERKMNS